MQLPLAGGKAGLGAPAASGRRFSAARGGSVYFNIIRDRIPQFFHTKVVPLISPSLFRPRRSFRPALFFLLGAAFWAGPNPVTAQLQLNEIVATANQRLTMADAAGRVRPGSGLFWADLGFSAPGWSTGTAPLGFGGAAGLGTNVAALMQNRTPNLYLRRTLTLSPAQVANEGQLVLKVRFDDGFIAWLNGREIARSNTGPIGHYIYADQKAYNFAASTTNPFYTPNAQTGTTPTSPTTGLTYPLGRVADFLQSGDNILAVQLVNREPDVSARIDASLEVITADAVLDLARYAFNEANDSAMVHRNLAGTITNTTEGTLPPDSWLARSAPAQSAAAWADFSLRSSLLSGAGYESSGALRYTYSQTDAVNYPASLSGPALPLVSQLAPGSLTPAHLADLRLTFRFRATANTAFNVRLDPDGNSPANSLTGLAALTPTAGTGTNQDAADDFSDSIGGVRTRTINATTGASTTTTAGTLRNTTTILHGPATRSATYTLTEDNAAGTGTNATPGALRFDVVSAPVTRDFMGFTWQNLPVRPWSLGAITAAQMKAGALQFDYHLPAGANWQVFLEPAAGTPSVADRLGLGTITGTGAWTTATLDTSTATNQTAFIAFMNNNLINSVKVVFLNDGTAPTGTRLSVDNLGYFPWRTYSVTLSTGTNQAAFLAAINAQPSPQFYPILEKTGTALAPTRATVTLDDFALTYTKVNAGTATTLVPYAATGWRYFPGLAEPSGGLVEPADFNVPGGTGSYSDWIEVRNTSDAPVNLANWSLSDARTLPTKFVFPAGTILNPGATLVIAADNRAAPAGASYLHAPFSLDADGEYLGLYHPSGALVDSLEQSYPPQTSFYSWGRDPATQTWGYLRTATPGQPNVGPWLPAQAIAPTFSVPGGFHPSAITLTLTTPTPGATIRYTVDGSEPTATGSSPYTSPLNLGFISDRIGHVIRARTFAPGTLPSASVSHTYLINQHASLRAAPAALFSGDAGTTFYKPTGILAINGGTYNNAIWGATAPTDYNMPVGDGRLTDPDSGSRPYERAAFLEYYFPDNRPGIRENIGIRVSSSPFSRPRLVLSDPPTKTLWDANATLKPSLNVFFRDDYGNPSINYPLIPETEVRQFSEFRLRAGKNDISNPFIRDEFIRRLWTDLGHEGTVGTFATVYLNGYFKGYYNLVERIREAFMQSHHQSTAEWDVSYIGTFENGDNLHWNTVLQPRLAADLTVKANWDALREILDVTNVADYILLNTYSAMWDWPHNNWAMARERSATGLWRCYVWDAEGGFNMGGKGPSYQTLNLDLLSINGANGTNAANNNTPIPSMFRRLMTSPEFRLLFADRVQRHLFNGGALTDARLAARRSTTQAEVAPLMSIAGLAPVTAWFDAWLHPSTGRRFFLFPNPAAASQPVIYGMLRDPNQDSSLADTLWPLTLPPTFSQHGGILPPASTLTITHSAPPASTLYYTTDGSDPRTWGGTPAPTALTYTAPFSLSGSSVTVKARVRNATTSEWSPLTEARFAQATVPATAANTVISEIMYNPPPLTTAEAAAGFLDKDDFEYIVLRNIGPAPIDVTTLRFQLGITFNFDLTTRPVIDPGQRLLLANNASALRQRYGPGIDSILGGEFFGNLGNGGELLRLEVTANATPIKAFTYSDLLPWPTRADGEGSSLILVNPAANPDHDLPTSWTASASPGGSPAGVPLNLNYSQWSAWSFPAADLANPALTTQTADRDQDGLPNLIEYLTGSNPTAPAFPPILTHAILPGPGGAQILRLTFPLLPSTSGYLLRPQSSTDLNTWQTDFTLATSTPAPEGTTLQTWEKITLPGEARHCMRLKAVPTP